MTTEKQKPISKVIMCVACNNPLWKLTILSHFKPASKGEAPIVGSTQWESANEAVKNREPKDWNCPICKREFRGTWKNKKGSENHFLRYFHPEIGKRTDEMID